MAKRYDILYCTTSYDTKAFSPSVSRASSTAFHTDTEAQSQPTWYRYGISRLGVRSCMRLPSGRGGHVGKSTGWMDRIWGSSLYSRNYSRSLLLVRTSTRRPSVPHQPSHSFHLLEPFHVKSSITSTFTTVCMLKRNIYACDLIDCCSTQFIEDGNEKKSLSAGTRTNSFLPRTLRLVSKLSVVKVAFKLRAIDIIGVFNEWMGTKDTA